MLGDGHVRFGGRAGETDQPQGWHRAPVRPYDALTYTVIEPPDEIVRGTRMFLQRSGLTYGAFDFAVTTTGEWIMFECNAGGQWGWLAEECNLPIAEAFAAELVEGQS